jgi:hypothetical protein
MKTFYTQSNIGKSKYCINHNDGVKKHKDGSAFFGILTFSNKTVFENMVKILIKDGYTQTN